MTACSKPAICICIDRNLMWNINHVYYSIKEFCKEFNFYILCDKDVLKYKVRKWEKYATMIYDVDIPEIDVGKLKGRCRIRSKAMYYRFLAPHLIKTDRLIYVDNDVVFNHDITELWEKDLNGKLLGAVQDPLRLPIQRHVDMQYNIGHGELGCDLKKMYASGILVIDCEQWRKSDVFRYMIEYWQDHPILDMLLMNVVCNGWIKRLADSWCVPINYMKGDRCTVTDKVYKTVKCWHWHGRKPWWNIRPSKAGLEIYKKYNRPIE